MIDLHCHILPGVDDGADDLAQAMQMCELAHRDGCRAIVATPHLRHERYENADRRLLEQAHRGLCEAVHRRFGDELRVFLGGEIAVHSQSLAEIDALPESSLLPMAGSRYLLLELSTHALGPDPVEMVYELGLDGWRPIIAHPERISWLVADPGLLAAIVDHGGLLQLTAMSLTGAFGSAIQSAADQMMDQGWVRFVCSDAHDERIRPPGLSAARRRVSKEWGGPVAQALFENHPRAVLQDQPLEPTPPPEARPAPSSDGKSPGWMARLKRFTSR